MTASGAGSVICDPTAWNSEWLAASICLGPRVGTPGGCHLSVMRPDKGETFRLFQFPPSCSIPAAPPTDPAVLILLADSAARISV